jgi:hypothetical protein
MMTELFEASAWKPGRQLPGVHESYKMLLPLLAQDRKDLFRLGVQHLALLCNLVCERLKFCTRNCDQGVCECQGVAWNSLGDYEIYDCMQKLHAL